MSDPIKPYMSDTLECMEKFMTQVPEDGKPVDFPFHLENFCKEMDCKILGYKQNILTVGCVLQEQKEEIKELKEAQLQWVEMVTEKNQIICKLKTKNLNNEIGKQTGINGEAWEVLAKLNTRVERRILRLEKRLKEVTEALKSYSYNNEQP